MSKSYDKAQQGPGKGQQQGGQGQKQRNPQNPGHTGYSDKDKNPQEDKNKY